MTDAEKAEELCAERDELEQKFVMHIHINRMPPVWMRDRLRVVMQTLRRLEDGA